MNCVCFIVLCLFVNLDVPGDELFLGSPFLAVSATWEYEVFWIGWHELNIWMAVLWSTF